MACGFGAHIDKVSIHAPTWGATGRGGGFVSCKAVSIHAPTWGATSGSSSEGETLKFQSTRPRGARLRLLAGVCPHLGFNPRAHVGRDCTSFLWLRPYEVSIHAPTWGATGSLGSSRASKKFQSTRPRGARHKAIRS